MIQTRRRQKHLPNIMPEELKNMLGRTPAQSWLKPERVMIWTPGTSNSRERGALVQDPPSVDRSELKFVMHPPWIAAPPHANQVRPGPDILERFLSLADAPAQQIHEFASSFGALLVFHRIEERKKHQLVIRESWDVEILCSINGIPACV
jgi:hypothetical protein